MYRQLQNAAIDFTARTNHHRSTANVYSGFNGGVTITLTFATSFTMVEGTPGNPGYHTSVVTLDS